MARADVLARGVNLANWFWYPDRSNPNPYGKKDFALMRQMGVTYVRIPIDFSVLYSDTTPNRLNRKALTRLNRAIAQIQSQKLGVVVDLHSTPLIDGSQNNYSASLENPQFRRMFTAFWRSLAAHLHKTTNPDLTFIQPMNEPVFRDNPKAWEPIQQELFRAIREAAPRHTLIAVSASWQNISTLVQLQPLPDANVVYDFHFYEPFIFTHQGASWIGDGFESRLRNVPYPANPNNVQSLAQQVSDPTARAAILDYGQQQWDIQKLRSRIGEAAQWARQNGVTLICTEFGVFAANSSVLDRTSWMRDTRTVLEEFGIGWASWGYVDSNFGFAEWQGNQPILDREIVKALGLRLPPRLAKTDVLLGTRLGNVLVGDFRSNRLDGRGGNDILNGVGDSSGRNSVDVLIGGTGRDRFLLGDATTVFYDDGKPNQPGLNDYALIKDFRPGKDMIQLHGDRSQYLLGTSPIRRIRGTGIFLDTDRNGVLNRQDELIGIVERLPKLNLGATYFSYTGLL
jgi:endoglucanase